MHIFLSLLPASFLLRLGYARVRVANIQRSSFSLARIPAIISIQESKIETVAPSEITGPSRFRSFLTRIPDSRRAFRGISVSRAALLISRSTEETSAYAQTRRKPASWKRVPRPSPLECNPARRCSTRACVQLNPTISQEIIFPRMTVCAIESRKRCNVCRLGLRFTASVARKGRIDREEIALQVSLSFLAMRKCRFGRKRGTTWLNAGGVR